MSSLFSTPANPAPTSLFGTPASTSNAAPAATTSTTGGGLFGGLKPTAPATTSLFGNTTSAAPAASTSATSGGLFGGLQPPTNTTSSTAPKSSLFGGTTAVNSTATGTSLFGNSTAQPASNAPQGSLFQSLSGNAANNASQAQDGQSTVRTAYFESLLEKNKKRQREGAASDVGDIPSLQFGLGDISKRVRELGNSSYSNGGDSRAHYLLAASGVNPVKTLRELDAFNTQVGAAPNSTVQPDWEPDSHKYVEQLQSQMTLRMINEGLERANKRFDAFLQNNIDMNWAEQRRKLYEHFGLAPRSTSQDIPAGRESVSDRGGFGRTRNLKASRQDSPAKNNLSRSVFGQSAMAKSVIGSPAVGQGNIQSFAQGSSDKAQLAPVGSEDRFLREKEGKFSEKVYHLNQSRLEETFYPLLREFAEVESSPGSDSPSEVLLAYRTLIEITGEDTDTSFKPRKFRNDYLDDNPNSSGSLEIRQQIIKGSRKVLEKHFYESLQAAVTKNPKEAQVGGTPSRIANIKAYVRVRAARKDLIVDGFTLQQIGEDYCWAVLFYLLRCGFVDDAAQYVNDNKHAFNAIDRMLGTYIMTYARDGKLRQDHQTKVNNEYIQRMRLGPEGQTDPYKLACYKVIGRCDISRKEFQNVPTTVIDWMWLQFCLTREANRVEEMATDVYSLSDLQVDVRDIGQRHFKQGSETSAGYGTYFLLQILSGLFENAVEYLYKHNYVAAIHFAIALDFYGLLRVSDFNVSESDLLSQTTRGQPQIDFGRMVGYYTKDFRASNVIAATDYLALIYLNADLDGNLGRSYAGLCHEALRELVLETREFSTLLGNVEAENGRRIKGAIELRLPIIGLTDTQDYLRTVTIQAARVADENGRTTDAVLLYHLSEDYNSVISILSRYLSDNIALSEDDTPSNQPSSQQQNQNQGQQANSSLSLISVDDPYQLATKFINLYSKNAMYFKDIPEDHINIILTLIHIQEAKNLMLAGKYGAALQELTSLSLLPLTAQGSIPSIRHSAQNLSRLSHTLSRLIGPLLLWSIKCIGEQRRSLQNGADNGETYESTTREEIRQGLQAQAQDLMVFAGLVKLRLGQGVLERIMSGCGEVGVY